MNALSMDGLPVFINEGIKFGADRPARLQDGKRISSDQPSISLTDRRFNDPGPC